MEDSPVLDIEKFNELARDTTIIMTNCEITDPDGKVIADMNPILESMIMTFFNACEQFSDSLETDQEKLCLRATILHFFISGMQILCGQLPKETIENISNQVFYNLLNKKEEVVEEK